MACKEQAGASKEELIKLEKEVLRIHDEVMPKMSDIVRLQGILEPALQDPQIDSLMKEEIKKSLVTLNAGDSLMLEWMHNYKKPEEAPADSILAYLKKEEARIKQVSEVMLNGIREAESLAQKLSHGQ
jgi:hypothetical protein